MVTSAMVRGERNKLLALHDALVAAMRDVQLTRAAGLAAEPAFGPFRPGDVRHSCADITRARDLLGYRPVVGLRKGIGHTLGWFLPA